MIASLLKSPGLFLIFWLISTYYYLFPESFSHQRKLIIFHWSLSDSKSPQVSRSFLSILAVLQNVVVWMVSTRPLFSMSSSLFNNHLITVPRATIKIAIIVTFMFYSFFNSQRRSRYLSFFAFSFNFTLCSAGTENFVSSLSLLIIKRSGRLAEIRWSVCMSKSQRILVLFSRTYAGLCIYPLFVCSNLSFLHNF